MTTTIDAGRSRLHPGDWQVPDWLTIRKFAMPVVVFVLVVSAWEWISAAGLVSKIILPAPSAIVGALVSSSGELAYHTLHTVLSAFIGFTLGNAIGLVFAIVFVHSDLARRTVYPLAVLAQAIPIVAIVPVLILWLGNGLEPRIVITTFLVFFPMLVNALRGLQSASTDMNELLYTLTASRWQKLVILRLPAALPFLFAAIRLSACACIVAAIVAEWLAADRGLGRLIVNYGAQYRMPEVWASALVGTAVSLALYALVVWIERLIMPWARNNQPGV